MGLVGQTYILRDNIDDGVYISKCVEATNEYATIKRIWSWTSFLVYSYFFTDLFVHVLFKDFKVGVLQELNIAPTQFHSNAWVTMQTFGVLCKALGITPTLTLFLHRSNKSD